MGKIILPSSGPFALTLSGGGSKGAYTAGMLQFLAEVWKMRDIKIIYGSSTGALAGAAFGVYVATGDVQYLTNLLEIYRTVLDGDVLRKRHCFAQDIGGDVGALFAAAVAGDDSIYDTSPLKILIDRFLPIEAWNILIEAGKREDNPLEVGFAAVNLQTGNSELLTTRSHPDPKLLAKALWASASQPVFMQPIQIGDHQFVDGGVRDYNPIEWLFASDLLEDVTGIISINLDSPETAPWDTHFKDVGQIFFRTLDLLIGGVFNSDIKAAQLWNVILKVKEFMSGSQWKEFVAQLPPDVKQFTQSKLNKKNYVPIFSVEPLTPITLSPLSFKQPQMKNLVNKGFKEGLKIFGTPDSVQS